MRHPATRKVLALLSLVYLLGLVPAYTVCMCTMPCQDMASCDEMSWGMAAAEPTAGGTALHLSGACHSASVTPGQAVALPAGSDLHVLSLTVSLPGLSGSVVPTVGFPSRPAHLCFRADRSSDRYILFASFLS